MIGKLKGRIDSTGLDWLLIDVGGVGYHVGCSSRTLSSLPGVGEAAELFTEMLVSQDMIRLVGFASAHERDWFRLLQSVQGVGTKVALAILSTLPVSELASAIALQDKAMIGRAPGVGKKLAERITLELRDKVSSLAAFAHEGGQSPITDTAMLKGRAAVDAISALVNLGYGQTQASNAVAAAVKKGGDEQKMEALIRQALKELAVA